MNKLKYILILFLVSFIFKSKAQDPHFSQFYSNPVYQSPSFAGAIKGYRASLNYRNQWTKMPGLFYTTTFALDYNLSALNSGLGIFAMRDQLGSSRYANNSVGMVYSYNVKINRKVYFRPGVGFYYSQRSIDESALRFISEMYNNGAGVSPILPGDFQKSGVADASVSALFLVDNLWIGLSADHLAQPNITLTDETNRLDMKFTLFGGYKLVKKERLVGTRRQYLTIAANYKHQGVADQLDMGVYWNYSDLTLGVWYRDLPFIKDYSRRDALVFLVGYKYKQLSFAYSYDFTISRLITSTGGAHEISLIFLFDIKQKKKFRPIPCPHF